MTHPAPGRAAEPTPSLVGPAVWRARWLVLAAVLVAGAVGYLLSSSQDERYFAQSSVVFSAQQGFDPLGRQTSNDPTRFVADQSALIGSQPIMERAANSLGTTTGDVARGLEVDINDENTVLTVGVSGPSGEIAAERANALVTAYRQYVAESVADEAATASVATTDPAVLEQIGREAAIYGDGVDLVEPAFAPGDPASPVPGRDAGLLAALAGLVVIGIAIARRPRKTPDTADVGTALGTVAVGRGGDDVDLEGHALALVALDYARGDEPSAEVLVTSTSADGSAPSVAHGLALAAVARGRRVLLVDAQPDSRALFTRTGAARPRANLEALGQSTDEPADVLTPLGGSGTPSALALLGSSDDAPVERAVLRAALDRLAGSFDLVLIAAGPVAQTAGAYALVQDAGVVVAAIRSDQGSAGLAELRAKLQAASRSLAGVIVVQPSRPGRRSAVFGRTGVRESDGRRSSEGTTVPPQDQWLAESGVAR